MEDLLELAFRLIAGVFRAVAWLMDALFILDFFERVLQCRVSIPWIRKSLI